MRRLKIIVALLLLLTLALTPGCWDRIEIDERAFVLGAAIDLVPRSETRIEPMPGQVPLRDNIYEMTVEIPIVSQMAGSSGGAGGGGGDGMPHIVVSSTGADISEINRAITHRSNRVLFYGHQKVLIFGEELARKGIRPLLDFFERDPEPNKRTKILIAEGEGKDVLKSEPKLARAASLYIYEIMEHERYSSRFPNSTIGRVISQLREDGNTLIARVRGTKEGMVIGGSAVIKEWKMVGWLGELETTSALLILGEMKGGMITIDDPRNQCDISLRINEIRRKLTSRVQGDDVTIIMEIEAEGDIVENMAPTTAFSRETVDIVEAGVARLIEENIHSVVRKVQEDFNVDIFQFNRLLAIKDPKAWEALSPRWDEIFPNVKVEVDVNVKVRRFGIVR
jgi:Ger(x)C family germination protein